MKFISLLCVTLVSIFFLNDSLDAMYLNNDKEVSFKKRLIIFFISIRVQNKLNFVRIVSLEGNNYFLYLFKNISEQRDVCKFI